MKRHLKAATLLALLGFFAAPIVAQRPIMILTDEDAELVTPLHLVTDAIPRHTMQVGITRYSVVSLAQYTDCVTAPYDMYNTVVTDWFGNEFYASNVWETPTLFASYHWTHSKKIQWGAIATYTGQFGTVRYRITDKRKGMLSRQVIALMPSCNFTYVNTPIVRLYMGAAAGAAFTFRQGYDQLREYEDVDGASISFAGHFTLFGISVGKKIVGFAEVGCGYKGVLNAGIGYRF